MDDAPYMNLTAWLDPGLTHEATLTWSCGPQTWEFTTASFDTPIAGADLVGKTYLIESTGQTPMFEIAGQVILNHWYLMTVESVSGSDLTVLIASEQSGNQKMCHETVRAVADFSANPTFQLTVPVLPAEVPHYDVQLGGTFSELADMFGCGGLVSIVDFDNEFGFDCGLIVGDEVKCDPCPVGTGDECIGPTAFDTIGEAVPVVVVERAAADPACP